MSLEPKPLQGVEYPVRRTGLPDHRVYELCRKGLIPHVRLGRRIRFDPDQIEVWIREGGTGLPQSAT